MKKKLFYICSVLLGAVFLLSFLMTTNKQPTSQPVNHTANTLEQSKIKNRPINIKPPVITGAKTLFSKLSSDVKKETAVPGLISVKLKPGTDITKIAALKDKVQDVQNGLVYSKISLKPGVDTDKVLKEIQNDKNVETAGTVHVYYPSTTFNDTYYTDEWHMPKINAPTAYDTAATLQPVKVAVVDTGVSSTHPDLAGKVVAEYNAVYSQTGPGAAQPTSTQGMFHGTHVAGIIAATANNSTGVAGVAPNAQIMAVQAAFDTSGLMYSTDIANGIYWATDHGAQVINLSLAGPYDVNIHYAVNWAMSHGVVVVAADGNGPNIYKYPAALPGVVAVSATDSNDQIAYFSNYGPEVAVAAPGVSIYSTSWDSTTGNGYLVADGTSMASPMVAAEAAIILGKKPSLSSDQVIALIERSAIDLGAAGRDDFYGNGRIDISKALQIASDTIPPTGSLTINSGATSTTSKYVTLNISANDTDSGMSDMMISNDPGFTGGAWEPYKTTENWTLTEGEATKTVYIKFRDYMGNESAIYSGSITVTGYNYPFTGLWNFKSGSSMESSLFYATTPTAFSWNRSKLINGDFNGDGKKDIAVLYNYGNNTMGIFTFLSDGNSYKANRWWFSGAGAFSWDRSQVTSGDFNNDGYDDIAILYNYGNNTTALFTFTSNKGTSFTPTRSWISGTGAFSWDRSKVTSGDYNNDGKDEVATFYNYGSNTTGIFVFTNSNSVFKPSFWWKSGTGEFSWDRIKIASGDFDNDGNKDIATLYNYGNNTTAIFNFKSTGTTFVPKLWWRSGTGAFSWNYSKIAAGDLNGDGKSDLSILYNYGNNTTGFFNFSSNGSAFSPSLWWKTAYGTFAWDRASLMLGDTDGDTKADYQLLYNYGMY